MALIPLIVVFCALLVSYMKLGTQYLDPDFPLYTIFNSLVYLGLLIYMVWGYL